MTAPARSAGTESGAARVPGVVILLSTYNGSAYLDQQIESLQAQAFTRWTLWVRDDGSTDGTREIIDRWRRKEPRIHPLPGDGVRRGACASFGHLLSAVSGDYTMFCDQDDIWRPEKIAVMHATIRQHEARLGADTPILLHSDLQLMTQDGRLAGRSFMRAQGIRHVEGDALSVLLVQNFVTGCATIFNRPLRDAAAPVPPEAVMHDWWMALVAAALGQIEFLAEPTVWYRQHRNNAVGLKRLASRESLRRLVHRADIEQDLARALGQADALGRRLSPTPDMQTGDRIAARVAALREGGPKALLTALRTGVRKQGIIRRLAFYFLLLERSVSRGR